VDAPSLQAFKARLDVALGSLVWWLATLHVAGGLEQMITVVLFNPGHLMIIDVSTGLKISSQPLHFKEFSILIIGLGENVVR